MRERAPDNLNFKFNISCRKILRTRVTSRNLGFYGLVIMEVGGILVLAKNARFATMTTLLTKNSRRHPLVFQRHRGYMRSGEIKNI